MHIACIGNIIKVSQVRFLLFGDERVCVLNNPTLVRDPAKRDIQHCIGIQMNQHNIIIVIIIQTHKTYQEKIAPKYRKNTVNKKKFVYINANCTQVRVIRVNSHDQPWPPSSLSSEQFQQYIF